MFHVNFIIGSTFITNFPWKEVYQKLRNKKSNNNNKNAKKKKQKEKKNCGYWDLGMLSNFTLDIGVISKCLLKWEKWFTIITIVLSLLLLLLLIFLKISEKPTNAAAFFPFHSLLPLLKPLLNLMKRKSGMN